MAIRCAQGTVLISSTLTVGQTIDIDMDGAGNALTDFHAAAKRAVVFAMVGVFSSGFNDNFNLRPSIGFATGTAARRSYSGTETAGGNPSSADSRWRDDACIMVLASGGGVDGLVDYNGEITNGFQLIVDDQLGSSRYVSWFAVWGDELDHAINDFTSPAATGNVDYNVGLNLSANSNDDKGVIFIGGVDAAVDTASADLRVMLGMAAGNTPANGVALFATQDNVNPPVTYSYCKSGECVAASTTADAVAERSALTQWNSDGWRLNWTEVNGSAGLFRYSALTLKGPQLKLFDILSRTDTTQTDEVIGYDPLGLIMASASRAESSSDTTTAGAFLSVGFGTSGSSRSVAAVVSADATSASDGAATGRADAIYASIPTTAAASAVDGLLDLVDTSAPGGGFTFVQDDTDPVAAFIFGLAIGQSISGVFPSALHDTAYYVGGMVEDEW